ncbi:hypothetical protein LCGC14_2366170, partial [marine sediment metagenome]
MAVKSPNASGIGYYNYTPNVGPSSTPTFASVSLTNNNDPLILRFRVALAVLVSVVIVDVEAVDQRVLGEHLLGHDQPRDVRRV